MTLRRRLVLERLALHHVAPVAGGVADREQDRLVLRAGARERLLAPRVPVDRIVRVLEQVRARLAGRAGSSLVADERRVPAEADRPRRARTPVRSRSRRSPRGRPPRTAPERERADGGAEPAAPELLAHADRLELADARSRRPARRGSRRRSARPAPRRRSRASARYGQAAIDVREARLGDARRRPDVAVDRDALGEVAGLDRAVAEAVGQRRQLGRLGELARVEVRADSPGSLEAVPRERGPHLRVVLERERGARVRLVEDLVEQLEPVARGRRARACPVRPSATTRRRRGRPSSQSRIRPLVLAPLVLAQAPGDVADVPRRARAEQAPLLERELLHRCDDLRT